jgi:predicted aldo/keto reductase-like oxidoreductase
VLVRWLTTRTKLDAAVIRVRNLGEFVETYSGAGKDLRAQDVQAVKMMINQADRTACRLCTQCQPHCPQQVPIAEILRFERYAVDDNDWNKARTLYAKLPRKGDACMSCETCIPYCSQGLRIPDKLAEAHALLS